MSAHHPRAAGLCLLIPALLLSLAVASDAIDVRTVEPVYEFLDRAELLGVLDEPLHGPRPYSRLTVARLLAQANDHRGELDRVDREVLAMHLVEFADELAWLDEPVDSEYTPIGARWMDRDPAWWFGNGRDVVSFRGNDGPRDWSLGFNPHLRGEWYNRLTDRVGESPIRSTVWATGVSARFRHGAFSAFGLAVDNHIESSSLVVDSLRYPYRYSDPVSGPDGNIDFYDTEAEIAWHSEHIELVFGKLRQRWGGGQTGSLILNDHALPHTHLRLRGRWGPFMMTMAQGRLQTEPRILASEYSVGGDGPLRTIPAKKWYAAQWFEIHPWRTLRLAFFEQVIYGERDFDWEYLNPLMFIQAAEHYTGDPDNMLLGFEIRWLAWRRVALTTQVMLDEFRIADFGDNSNGDKWGLLAALRMEDPAGIPHATAGIEYARLRPFFYTHKFPINRATHLGANLGYALPPNSDQLTMMWRQQVNARLAVTVTLAQLRHGRNPDGAIWGGAITDSDADKAARAINPSLDGDRLTQREIGLELRYIPAYRMRVDLSVRRVSRELDPVVGAKSNDSHLLGQVLFRYYPY